MLLKTITIPTIAKFKKINTPLIIAHIKMFISIFEDHSFG